MKVNITLNIILYKKKNTVNFFDLISNTLYNPRAMKLINLKLFLEDYIFKLVLNMEIECLIQCG